MNSFHRTVKTALVEQLRNEIIRGAFPPGHHLRLEDLAAQFEVSTMPVREALRELESEGIVTSVPHRGTFVTELTADELRDIYEMRAMLEALATRSAVPRLTPEIIATMAQQIEVMGAPEADIPLIVRVNTEFHTTLYRAAGRQHLNRLIVSMRHSTHHYLYKYIARLGMDSAQDEHRAIFEASRTGEAEKAAQLVHHHIIRVGFAVAEHVEKEAAEGPSLGE